MKPFDPFYAEGTIYGKAPSHSTSKICKLTKQSAKTEEELRSLAAKLDIPQVEVYLCDFCSHWHLYPQYLKNVTTINV